MNYIQKLYRLYSASLKPKANQIRHAHTKYQTSRGCMIDVFVHHSEGCQLSSMYLKAAASAEIAFL